MATTPKTMTELDRVEVVTPDIIILAVEDPEGETPVNKVLDLETLFANIPSDITTAKKLTSSGNTSFTGILQIPTWTPGSSSATCKRGRMGMDNQYLYVAIADNTIRRIPIPGETF